LGTKLELLRCTDQTALIIYSSITFVHALNRRYLLFRQLETYGQIVQFVLVGALHRIVQAALVADYSHRFVGVVPQEIVILGPSFADGQAPQLNCDMLVTGLTGFGDGWLRERHRQSVKISPQWGTSELKNGCPSQYAL
jgi:hypothetical protein